jgi:hypothetical protein
MHTEHQYRYPKADSLESFQMTNVSLWYAMIWLVRRIALAAKISQLNLCSSFT